ncbi:MAG: hypothetical protein ACLQBA_08150, partial [Candidatus Binataceae bacterium]
QAAPAALALDPHLFPIPAADHMRSARSLAKPMDLVPRLQHNQLLAKEEILSLKPHAPGEP